MSDPSLPRRIGHLAGDAALAALLTAMSAIPFGLRVSAMGSIAARSLGPAIGYRRRIEDNLQLVYPDMPAAARRRFAQTSLDNLGRTLAENFFAEDFHRHLGGTALEGAGLSTLAEARTLGRPILFVSAHFGNHEAPRHLLAGLGDRIGGIYRPLSNPRIDARYRRTLATLGGPVFAQGREGTGAFLRHLRAGGWGVLFYDLHQPRGEILDFLGQPAATPTAAARLALKVGAPLVPWFGIRQLDGRSFRCVIEAPIAPAEPTDMMRALHDRLEARIAETPEQWMWVHRRWKYARRLNAAAGLG